jgi:hypothetical protein
MSNASNLQLALYLVSSIAVGAMFKSAASAGAKALGLLAVTSIVTVLTAYFDGGNVWDADLIRTQIEGFSIAAATYFGLWRPVGVSSDSLWPDAGIGPKS